MPSTSSSQPSRASSSSSSTSPSAEAGTRTERDGLLVGGPVRLGLAAKLSLAMLLVALVPLIAFAVTARGTTGELTRQQGQSFATVARTTADQVSQSLIKNLSQMQTLAAVNPVLEQIEGANRDYTGVEQEIRARIQAKDRSWRQAPSNSPLIQGVLNTNPNANFVSFQLDQFQERFPQHIALLATDRYGALVGTTDRTPGYDLSEEGWWAAAWNDGNGGAHVGQPRVDGQRTVIDLAVPIEDAQGDPIGVLKSTLDASEIGQLLGTIGETGQTALYHVTRQPDGDPDETEVLLAADDAYVGDALPLALAGGDDAGWARSAGLGTEDAINGYAEVRPPEGVSDDLAESVAGLDWRIVGSVDAEQALAPVRTASTINLAAGLIAALAAAGLAVVVARVLTNQMNHIRYLFDQIQRGNRQARTPVVTSDELGQMAQGLNDMLDQIEQLTARIERERDAIENAIMQLLDEISGVAEGDLTVHATVTEEATGALADAFNFMLDQLRDIITHVQEVSYEVSSTAAEIRVATESLAEDSARQSRRILDTSSEIGTLADGLNDVSRLAVESATVSERALDGARRGREVVSDTVDGMGRIRERVQQTSKGIKRLGERSQEIGEIVQLIDDIAERTTILALNASIQAQMAGEAGRGFAVLAEEVESLAERSAEATRQIAALVEAIQTDTNEAAAAMDETTREVVADSELAAQAGEQLDEIERVSREAARLARRIAEASEAEAERANSSAAAMREVSALTEQTADGTEDAAHAVSQLADYADDLRASVSTFRLPDDAFRPADRAPGAAPDGRPDGAASTPAEGERTAAAAANGEHGRDTPRPAASAEEPAAAPETAARHAAGPTPDAEPAAKHELAPDAVPAPPAESADDEAPEPEPEPRVTAD